MTATTFKSMQASLYRFELARLVLKHKSAFPDLVLNDRSATILGLLERYAHRLRNYPAGWSKEFPVVAILPFGVNYLFDDKGLLLSATPDEFSIHQLSGGAYPFRERFTDRTVEKMPRYTVRDIVLWGLTLHGDSVIDVLGEKKVREKVLQAAVDLGDKDVFSHLLGLLSVGFLDKEEWLSRFDNRAEIKFDNFLWGDGGYWLVKHEDQIFLYTWDGTKHVYNESDGTLEQFLRWKDSQLATEFSKYTQAILANISRSS